MIEHLRPKVSRCFVVTVAGINPAFTICTRSSSIKFLSAALITIGVLPAFCSVLVRLLQIFVIRGQRIDVHLFSAEVREGGDGTEILIRLR